MPTVQCQSCGKAVEAARETRRYCEDCTTTRQRERNRRSYAKVHARRDGLVCERCGAVFTAERSDAKYCIPCKTEVRRARERAQKHPRGTCGGCGAPTRRSDAKLCKACEYRRRGVLQTGENNPRWKGGRIVQGGYAMVLTERNGVRDYWFEHIIVWESTHGPLPEGCVVHHLNGIKTDNHLENLQAMPRKHHGPWTIVVPYQARIRQLEARIRELESGG